MKCLRLVIIFFGLLLLNACGIGGGGGNNNDTPPATDQSIGGLWFGSMKLNGDIVPGELLGITTDAGELFFFSFDSEYKFSGTVQSSGTDLFGDGRAYAPPGTAWQDVSTVTAFALDGAIRERLSITGAWSADSGDTGEFELNYDSEYEKESSLSFITGLWTAYDQDVNPVVNFIVDDNGVFFGQNVVGCTSNGNFTLIDTAANVYAINSTIAGCLIAGDYTGLGSLGDIDDLNDTLVFAISNEDMAIVQVFFRN